MSYLHHNTMKKYTAALLDLFNDLEIQYTKSDNSVESRNIPITFSSKEKATVLDQHTTDQLLEGNYNILPRSALVFSAMNKSDQRVQNKNNKINQYRTETSLDYMYNSVPYEFMFELVVLCRGMNEATMIIEQVCPIFNPTVNIDIWDAENLNEPTRIPVKLLDVSVEPQDYEELSSNIVELSFGISITGNLYPPIKSVGRVKEFKMQITDNTVSDINKKSILGWDVTDEGIIDESSEEHIIPETIQDRSPSIIDLIGTNIQLGENDLTVIYEDIDNTIAELTFEWNVLAGDATIQGTTDTAILNIQSGNVEVEIKITDQIGNYTSLQKEFTL